MVIPKILGLMFYLVNSFKLNKYIFCKYFKFIDSYPLSEIYWKNTK